MKTLLRILLLLAEWLSRRKANNEYQRREEEREKLRDDPIAWANEHFNGRVSPNDDTKDPADKAGDNRSPD